MEMTQILLRNGNWEATWEAMAISQTKDHGGLNQGGSSGSGKKWTKPTVF